MDSHVNDKQNPRNQNKAESLRLPEYGHDAVVATRHYPGQADPTSFPLGIAPNQGVTPVGSFYPGPPIPGYHARTLTVTQAPTTRPPPLSRYWSTGLFDCFEDWSSCKVYLWRAYGTGDGVIYFR